MSSRDRILNKLRAAKRPPAPPTPEPHLHVVPLQDTSPAALRALFIEQARKHGMAVHETSGPAQALQIVQELAEGDNSILSWEAAALPLPELPDMLAAAGITPLYGRDDGVRLGLTGAEAALAATGSLVLFSGPGQSRAASLLPDVHIALLPADRIQADMETWAASVKDDFRRPANITLITGPSKTGDIAQELVLGAHGPRAVHVLLL